METSKFALVTGGNKGIGLATVKQLAEKGIHVFLGSRDQARGEAAVEQLKADGLTNVSLVKVDLEDATTFVGVKEVIEQEAGKLDILVNNAGIQIEDPTWSANTSFSIGPDVLRKTFEVNFFGLVELTSHLIPLLKKSEAGRIVNLSSILGSLTVHADTEHPLYNTKTLAYNASKAALNMYTVHLAHALKDTNIQSNSAHPGWVKTDMGTDAAPMLAVDGAKTGVDLALTSDPAIDGKYIHLGEELPW